MWGPIVLAGDWGAQRSGRGRGAGAAGAPAPPPVAPVAMLVAGGRPLDEWVKPDPARAANFRTIAIGRVPTDPDKTWEVPLAPFYRTQRRTYSVYFDVVTPAEFTARANATAAEAARLKKLEAATVAYIQPGDTAREAQFNYQSDLANRQVTRTGGRTSRGGAGWFSYDLTVEPAAAMALVVTCQHVQEPPTPASDFQILVDNTPIATFEMNTKTDGYYDAQYAIPAALVQGKTKVTVKFQATGTSRITPIFGVRVIRADGMK
jgi:hypothetical protein